MPAPIPVASRPRAGYLQLVSDGGPIDIHPAAQAFEGAADTYERGRPHYPATAVARLVHETGVDTGSDVLDLAAGTGRLTTHLVDRGARVVAVEPVRQFRRVLAAAVPTATVLAGTAEAIPVDNDSVDVLTVGQAFHWFDGPAALTEIDRVVRPGGAIGLMWNARPMHDPAHRAASEILAPFRAAAPGYARMAWRTAFETSTVWAPLTSARFTWRQRVDVQVYCDRFLSVSVIAGLPAADRERVRERLVDAYHSAATGDAYDLAYETHLYWTRRMAG